jgi:hypothetical protein
MIDRFVIACVSEPGAVAGSRRTIAGLSSYEKSISDKLSHDPVATAPGSDTLLNLSVGVGANAQMLALIPVNVFPTLR